MGTFSEAKKSPLIPFPFSMCWIGFLQSAVLLIFSVSPESERLEAWAPYFPEHKANKYPNLDATSARQLWEMRKAEGKPKLYSSAALAADVRFCHGLWVSFHKLPASGGSFQKFLSGVAIYPRKLAANLRAIYGLLLPLLL